MESYSDGLTSFRNFGNSIRHRIRRGGRRFTAGGRVPPPDSNTETRDGGFDAREANRYTPIDLDRRRVAIEKLDLLILKTLDLAPLHGYGIGQRIEQTSGGVFRITLGALYPALQRLERPGWSKGSGMSPTTTAAPATTR